MMIELLAFTLFGIGLGIFTGLIPGIHVNTVVLLLLGFEAVISPYMLAVTIIAAAITTTIWDFVPSILLGMPEPSTALSVLPGHQMLLEGRGVEAIYLTIIGGVGVILLSVALLPVFMVAIPLFYQNIHNYTHWFLIAIALAIILSESRISKKLFALLCFVLTGMLGLITLNGFALPSSYVFFPIFTGLFGMSTLLISMKTKSAIPEQIMELPAVEKKLVLSGTLKALFSGVLLGTLPGVGAAQATVLTQQITRKNDNREFLISIGGINTAVALFSLVSLYTIFKPRSGAAVAVQQVMPGFGVNELLLLMAVALTATGISSLLLIKSMKGAVRILRRLDYQKLTLCIIVSLVVMTLVLTGAFGLLVLFTSTSMGLLAPLFGIRRSILMGVLMLPLILFYMGI